MIEDLSIINSGKPEYVDAALTNFAKFSQKNGIKVEDLSKYVKREELSYYREQAQVTGKPVHISYKNQQFVKQIKELKGDSLIIVGLAHVDGLKKRLEQEGYEVETTYIQPTKLNVIPEEFKNKQKVIQKEVTYDYAVNQAIENVTMLKEQYDKNGNITFKTSMEEFLAKHKGSKFNIEGLRENDDEKKSFLNKGNGSGNIREKTCCQILTEMVGNVFGRGR